MKKKWVGFIIFACVFCVACSGQEDTENEPFLETEHELEHTKMEKEENDEVCPEFVSEEFVNDGTVYLYSGSDVLRFEDRVFVGKECYEYRDGYYYNMQGQGLVEFTPDGMENAYVTQTRDYLVYWDSLTSTVDRIVLVEPDTGVVVRSFDLQEFSNAGMIAFEGTHEDNIYYRTYNYETESATVEKINCVDMSHEVIFECDEFIRNVTAREDGSLMVSALDLGWFKIDPRGQITLILEKLEGAWDEYVTWYGESGYYTLVEYYRNHSEVLHINEDGTRERLYGFDDFWEDIYLEDYFVNIDETGMFSLYDYISAPLDIDHNQADIWYEINIGENPPFKTLQVVETEIIEAGYRVENYYTADDTVWIFLKKGKDLVVRSWKMGEREEYELYYGVFKEKIGCR